MVEGHPLDSLGPKPHVNALSNSDNNNDDDYETPTEGTSISEPLTRPFLPQARNQ